MHILVLQHAEAEHPGIFRSFLAEDGHSYEAVEMDKGGALPTIDNFDALWVLGGPMDVWQEEAHPWLRDEKLFIKDAVETRGVPFLGLCLGHQLLADALGGEVKPSKTPEIGIMDVQLTEAGATGVLFDGLSEQFKSLQWHSAEVAVMPSGATCLATTTACSVQAMKWGTRAFSAQFHIEIESDTVGNWLEIDEYADALNAAMGPDGGAKMKEDADRHMSEINKSAERFYINWLQTTART